MNSQRCSLVMDLFKGFSCGSSFIENNCDCDPLWDLMKKILVITLMNSLEIHGMDSI